MAAGDLLRPAAGTIRREARGPDRDLLCPLPLSARSSVGVLWCVLVINRLATCHMLMPLRPRTSRRRSARVRPTGRGRSALSGLVGTSPHQTGQTIGVEISGAGAVQAKMRPVGGAIRGDFGDSLRFLGQPAMPIVLDRFPLTGHLMLAAAAYSPCCP
jgi:hypothetical protein